MNLNCFTCGDLFTEWDYVKCDGCERLSHRMPCGAYELIERDGEHLAYFFCNPCNSEPGYEDDDTEFDTGYWEDESE